MTPATKRAAAKKAPAKKKAAPRKAAAPKAKAEDLTIHAAMDVHATPARVWAAITSPDEINRWFTARCEFEARVGGRVLYWWSSEQPARPDYVAPSRFGTAAEVRIESWEPPRSFRVRALNHWPGTVEFRIDPTPGGSRVAVEHEGFPQRDDWHKGHVEGWKYHLDLLKHYLEKPETEYEAYRLKMDRA